MAPATSDPPDTGLPHTGVSGGRRPPSRVRVAAPGALRSAAAPRLVAAVLALGTLAIVAVRPLTGGDGAVAGEAARVVARYAGIPQQGLALGRDDAPVTVVEFVDLQCPACARFAQAVLPTVLERYVRPGRVRLELRPLAFVGQDSVRAAQAVAGAAAEGAAWPYAERLFAEQGEENSGYVTAEWLHAGAVGLPGVDADRVAAYTGNEAIARAERDAAEAQITATPSFLVGPTGGELRLARLPHLDIPSFTAALDRALAGAAAR